MTDSTARVEMANNSTKDVSYMYVVNAKSDTGVRRVNHKQSCQEVWYFTRKCRSYSKGSVVTIEREV